MDERIDYRTPREMAVEKENEEIARRFVELMEYFPSASRAMAQIAAERRSSRETVRHRLVRCGAYIPGARVGRSNGNKVAK